MNYKFELVQAIEAGDLTIFRKLFEKEDLLCRDYGVDEGLIHYAAGAGTLEIVQFLVESGADINLLGGTYDCPAVTYSAECGKLDIVRFLVDAGSELDVRTALTNPLLRAAAEGHFDVVKYLLTTDIDRNASYRGPSGALINALVEAEQAGHKKIVDLLKAHGCRRPVEGIDIPRWEPKPERMINQTPKFRQYQQISEYMEERFGSADPNGMQELFPVVDGMTVSINVIRPNDEHPWLVLFTNGMSDRPMKVPAGKESWQYAELVMHLPPEWVHPRDANGDPKWLWPVQWLRKMAYYPHLNETWLGLPATIASSDDPPVPLGPNTEQTCLLMVPDFSNLKPPLQMENGKQVHFYTVVPIFAEERDYELKHGMKAFLQRLVQHQVPMQVDIHRTSFIA